jgi:hypothetical protein
VYQHEGSHGGKAVLDSHVGINNTSTRQSQHVDLTEDPTTNNSRERRTQVPEMQGVINIALVGGAVPILRVG